MPRWTLASRSPRPGSRSREPRASPAPCTRKDVSMSSNRSSSNAVGVADPPEAPVREPAPAPPAERSGAPTPPPAAAHTNGSRRPWLLGVLAVAALVGLGLGLRQYLWTRVHVSTDNAQVEGHVVPVLSKVAGYVTAVPVVDNQSVRAGDLLVQVDDREYRAKLEQND